MLAKDYPNTAVFYDVGLSDTLAYPMRLKVQIQILIVAGTHWGCLTNKDCNPATVEVYNSRRTGDLPLSAKEVVSALVKSKQKRIHLLFPDVQQQSDSSSCRLFTLAYAQTLCEGKDPAKTHYNHSKLRPHYLQCLQDRRMTPFPSTNVLYNPDKPLTTSFKIYCVCRLPNCGDKMVNCDQYREWYRFVRMW